jgi:hypothetical protein
MTNAAFVYEVVNHDTGKRVFLLEESRLAKSLAKRFDRDGTEYAIYRAKVAPLSNKRWVKFMSMLCNEKRDEIPFFHNANLMVSSDQPVEKRMRYWGDGECRMKLVDAD